MLRLTQTRTRKPYPLTTIIVIFSRIFVKTYSSAGFAQTAGTHDALYSGDVVVQ